MRRREEGTRAALVITQRADIGSRLSEAVAPLGFSAQVIGTLEHVETHADARPALVLTDLALRPTEAQWTSLARIFPRSVLWAVADPTESNIRDASFALKHGCHDCLMLPVTVEELGKKLAGIRRLPGPKPGDLDRYMSNEINLELPSDLAAIEHVVRLLAGCARDYRSYGPRTLVNLRIAVSEALSNAIIYGNGGDRSKKVRVRASVDAWRIKVQVSDEGPGFDPHSIPDPRRGDGLQATGGRGLFLLKQLADDVTFNDPGNSVTLTLRSEWEEAVVGEAVPPPIRDTESLVAMVERIRTSSGVDLHLWAENLDGTLEHVAPSGWKPCTPDASALRWLSTLGIRYAVQVLPEGDPAAQRWAEFGRDLLDEALSNEIRVAESRRELAERQEEIELLHSITETLGSATRVEEAAQQILRGVARVTGADRASLWIYEPATDELVLVASEGPAIVPGERVAVSSPTSVAALAFREDRVVHLEDVRELPRELVERFRGKALPWVAVPVGYARPEGGHRTVGVLNLIGRRTGSLISGAGETRLLQTLARQIGSAIAHLRLFEENVARERLIGELELAHDLQMKLLPDLSEFRELADVAARCVPARPVGGDFYQLFRLSDSKLGAMLGDVTSHGFSASLIMALSMSVSGIYVRQTESPAELLLEIHRALIHKLESAEMFMTVFYGVIDPTQGTMCYANAGHPHAFRLHGDRPPQRLAATSPPLGIAEYGGYGEVSVPWEPGDILCLFSDGLTNPSLRTTEALVLEAASVNRALPAELIVDKMFAARGRRGGWAPDDQTAFVLRA